MQGSCARAHAYVHACLCAVSAFLSASACSLRRWPPPEWTARPRDSRLREPRSSSPSWRVCAPGSRRHDGRQRRSTRPSWDARGRLRTESVRDGSFVMICTSVHTVIVRSYVRSVPKGNQLEGGIPESLCACEFSPPDTIPQSSGSMAVGHTHHLRRGAIPDCDSFLLKERWRPPRGIQTKTTGDGMSGSTVLLTDYQP